MSARRYTLQLTFGLGERFSIHELLAAGPARSGGEAYRMLEQFEVSGPERRFVRSLLRAKTNLWLFRCNQRRFCGDFIVVDMSSATALQRRRVYVIELKANEPIKRAGGVQLARWRDAIDEIAAYHGIIEAAVEPELIRGGEDEVLAFLGVVHP